jgi:hypothetical protein
VLSLVSRPNVACKWRGVRYPRRIRGLYIAPALGGGGRSNP